MFPSLKRLRLQALLLACLCAAAPIAHASQIKTLMRDMKASMRGAMASSTMPQFSQYLTRLENDVAQASRQPYRDDPSTYREGMQTLQRQFTPVDEAVRANDLPAAKNALRKINATRKHYHDLLN